MVSKSNEKRIPYLGTTSLRKVIKAVRSHPNNIDITVITGCVEVGDRERTQHHGEVGWKVFERTITEAEIDWKGSSLWLDRVESRLDESEAHDLSVRFMRTRCKGNEKLVEALSKNKWNDKKTGNRVSIEEGKPFKYDTDSKKALTRIQIPADSYFYFDFKNRNPNFDITNTNVKSNLSWEKWWNRLNTCEVCGKPLPAHGFQHRTLDVVEIQSKEIREGMNVKKEPDFNSKDKEEDSEFHRRNKIVKWIKNNLVDPMGFTSPKGHKLYKKDRMANWVLSEA